jgi:glucose/arabinose dehydrogenase
MFTPGLLSLLALAVDPAQGSVPGTEQFSMRVVASGLANPWEMIWGPDERIWITERTGRRVLRVNPADGVITPALTVPDVMQTHYQDGLLGMALLPAGDDHVSGRLAFGKDQKLYLTLGDGGFNQGSLICQPIRAQELPTAA